MPIPGDSPIKLSDPLESGEDKSVYLAQVADGGTFYLEHVKTFKGSEHAVAFMTKTGPYQLDDFVESLNPVLDQMNAADLPLGDIKLTAKFNSGKTVPYGIELPFTVQGLEKAGITNNTVKRIIVQSSSAMFSADISKDQSTLMVSVDVDDQKTAEIAFGFLAETAAIKNSGRSASEVGRLALQAIANPEAYQRKQKV